ncbi:MAG: glycerol acyltransferase [Deltaproteobacteria bacterium]|nr:MAG: glycerol acyltransferase [Deltaproteobacteria bacterium]
MILAANRGGGPLPYDALMIADALRHVHPARRAASPLVEGWLLELPLLGRLLVQSGAAAATVPNLRRLLTREQAVIVLPEGRQGFGRRFRGRYRLGRFTDAFARVAIEAGAPIVPVAVIGAEEAQPVLARFDAAGRLLGLPTLPLTPTLVPLPTKWTLHFGEPLHVAASYEATDAGRSEMVGRLRHQVRERLQGLVLEGLRRRRSVFLG